MTSSITQAGPAQKAVTAAPASTATKAPAGAPVAGGGETTHVSAPTKVTISAAGQLAAAANQEAMETPAQTAREAQGPDMQAKRLLAKEQASANAARA